MGRAGLPGAQVRAATNVPNRLEMSECRDRQVGTEVRALGSPSVQWTVRHCRWLPDWVAEALLVRRSWAVEKKTQVSDQWGPGRGDGRGVIRSSLWPSFMAGDGQRLGCENSIRKTHHTTPTPPLGLLLPGSRK